MHSLSAKSIDRAQIAAESQWDTIYDQYGPLSEPRPLAELALTSTTVPVSPVLRICPTDSLPSSRRLDHARYVVVCMVVHGC